ncbi:hypothetical protein C27AD_15259 [Salinisphaera hydrothermalis C27AD]
MLPVVSKNEEIMVPQELAQECAGKPLEPVDYQVVRKNVEFALSYLDRAAREAVDRGLAGSSVDSLDQVRARLETLVDELQLGEHFGSPE